VVASLWLGSFVLASCGSKGPADTLVPVVRELGEPGVPTADRTQLLYAVVDTPTRRAIDARAADLSARLGRPIDPAEAIQFRGFGPDVRVAAIEVEPVDETTARLKVSLSRIESKPGELMLDPLLFDAVREDGAWKLSLPSLAAEVARP